MFLSRNKKNNLYPCKPQFYYIKVGFQGVKIIWACFRDVDTRDKFETNIMFSEMPFIISIRGNVIWTKCLFNEMPCILTFEC